MDIRQAYKIIEDNEKATNDSFLDYLHERDEFVDEKFWEFYNAVRLISFERSKEEKLDRELTYLIMRTYSWFLKELFFHYSSKDSSQIKNLPEYEKLNGIYIYMLDHAVNVFLNGNYISDEDEEYLFNLIGKEFEDFHMSFKINLLEK